MPLSPVIKYGVFTFVFFVTMSVTSRAQSQETKLIPLEVLFGNPTKAAPQLSPDGKKMSYLAPVNNVLNVWVKTIGRDDDRAVTRDKDRGIRHYFWSQDNRHILYLQDIGGNENWRLYQTDLKSGATQDLTPFDNMQVRILDGDKHFPKELLIEMNKEDKAHHDVYHLDLPTGKLRLVPKNPGNISDWVTDTHFKVLGAVAAKDDGGSDFLVRPDEKSPWRTLIRWSLDDSSMSEPISFTKDGKSIYLKDSRDYNAARFVKLEIAGGKTEVIAQDPEYDFGGVMMHPDTYEIQMISFVKDKVENTVIDESIRADIERIQALHKGEFFIAARDNNDHLWIVGYNVDDGPVDYYLYDRKTKKFEFIFTDRPLLKEYVLAPMEPVSFQSRDGFTIHGYLTFPPGKERKNLPLILNVHGGPWARDTWGYNGQVQWLTNRGYACLQVNYRASTGYGKKFVNAGNKEWGGKCQDDLTDAVKWAIAQGYADPKKVAIFGGSYGGYAALAGATFTPDLYACAVDVVGPSNLITFIRSVPPYWSVYLSEFHKRVGNPDTEEEFLKSRSPLFKVNDIKIPMLIAQGKNDPRVKEAESEQIVEAMKKKGIDYEYLLFPDEGHGFAKPENRLKFYKSCEKFLSKHLPS